MDTGSSDLLVASTLCKPCDEVGGLMIDWGGVLRVGGWLAGVGRRSSDRYKRAHHPHTRLPKPYTPSLSFVLNQRAQVTISRSGKNDPVRPLLDLEKANGAHAAALAASRCVVCFLVSWIRALTSSSLSLSNVTHSLIHLSIHSFRAGRPLRPRAVRGALHRGAPRTHGPRHPEVRAFAFGWCCLACRDRWVGVWRWI